MRLSEKIVCLIGKPNHDRLSVGLSIASPSDRLAVDAGECSSGTKEQPTRWKDFKRLVEAGEGEFAIKYEWALAELGIDVKGIHNPGGDPQWGPWLQND